MNEIRIPRKTAAEMLDDIREMLQARKTPEEIEEMLSRDYEIAPLEKCTGEAHSNPHIDNCMVCTPRWGVVGAKIKIT